ncbi:Hypothetical predicted protein, partial [Scomber scombrus]
LRTRKHCLDSLETSLAQLSLHPDCCRLQHATLLLNSSCIAHFLVRRPCVNSGN